MKSIEAENLTCPECSQSLSSSEPQISRITEIGAYGMAGIVVSVLIGAVGWKLENEYLMLIGGAGVGVSITGAFIGETSVQLYDYLQEIKKKPPKNQPTEPKIKSVYII